MKLASTVDSAMYDEKIIREKVERISIYEKYLIIKGKNNTECKIQI